LSGRRLLWDIEAALCTALRGIKVPMQRGTPDEERCDALTLARWQFRNLQELHHEIQNYLELKEPGRRRETEETDPHPLAASAADLERLSAR
jgi:hypothetical protein